MKQRIDCSNIIVTDVVVRFCFVWLGVRPKDNEKSSDPASGHPCRIPQQRCPCGVAPSSTPGSLRASSCFIDGKSPDVAASRRRRSILTNSWWPAAVSSSGEASMDGRPLWQIKLDSKARHIVWWGYNHCILVSAAVTLVFNDFGNKHIH